eukprot:6220467-Prymnesium_polylepis.1
MRESEDAQETQQCTTNVPSRRTDRHTRRVTQAARDHRPSHGGESSISSSLGGSAKKSGRV